MLALEAYIVVVAAAIFVLGFLTGWGGNAIRRRRPGLRVQVKQGAKGKWRFTIRDAEDKAVAISPANGFDGPEEVDRVVRWVTGT